MPSQENNKGRDKNPGGTGPDGRPRRRRRPTDQERLTNRGLTPMRFELPDNALAGYPPAPAPEPPPPLMLEAPPAPVAKAGGTPLAALPAPEAVPSSEGAAGEGGASDEGAAASEAPTELSIPAPPRPKVGGPIRLAKPTIVFPRVLRRSISPKQRALLWGLLGLAVGVPVLLTLIGALTSPPHIRGVPNGHLVYLEAEAPSEKTTTLRGLYVAGPDGATRLLTHENEPQDTDGGVREWITQPALSQDGTQVAFEKQLITLQEEKQTIQNQIWVMSLAPGSDNLPRLVMDLTAGKLKQIVGLAWDSDSSLIFLEDGVEYSVPTETPDEPLTIPLDLHGLTLAATPDVSATRSPAMAENGRFAYGVQTPTGPQTLVVNAGAVTSGPAAVFALSPAGDRIAFIPPDSGDGSGGAVVRTYDLATNAYGADIPVHWGWSVFGRRHVTSLRWSPDGAQIAFTVSKPPVPEDEIFIVDLASGKTVQLPYRTGRAAWDWSK